MSNAVSKTADVHKNRVSHEIAFKVILGHSNRSVSVVRYGKISIVACFLEDSV